MMKLLNKKNYRSGAILLTFAMITGSCRTDITQRRTDFIPNTKILRINGTQILSPKNYKQDQPQSKKLATEFYNMELYAREFVHGDIIYLELIPLTNVKMNFSPKAFVNGTKLNMTPQKWGYRSFFAIHPENENPDVKLEIELLVDGNPVRQLHVLTLSNKQFPVSKTAMNVGKFSRTDLPIDKELQERIQKEYKLKEKIFKLDTPDLLTGVLSHPRNFHQLTSPFYEKRIYEQYEIKQGKKISQKPRISYHRGLDFYARTGEAIFAMGAGKIVLAESMYYEGNCVIIDHGSKILSIYMHMSKISAQEGQTIKAGELIGYAGSTGISTGAHLHVSMYVNSVPADPLSLLFLPIRD